MTTDELVLVTFRLADLHERIGRLEEAFGALAAPLPTVEERLLQLEAARH